MLSSWGTLSARLPVTRIGLTWLLLFLPWVVLILVAAYWAGKAEIDREMIRLQAQETLNVGLGAGALSTGVEAISRDLVFLAHHSALRHAVNDPSPQRLAQLAEDLTIFSRSKRHYDQIRWIDETGMERVRVDRIDGMATVVPADRLQNKGKRYFFTDTMRLARDEIFVSPLDLNIEHNKIEVPYKPMLRVATRVFDDRGQARGIVILNYLGRELLRAFADATSNIGDHAMLVNGEGYWLKHPDDTLAWGFMFQRPDLSLANQAPSAWMQMRNAASGQMRLDDGLWTWQTVYPLRVGQQSSTGAATGEAASRGVVAGQDYVWKSVSHLSDARLDAIAHAVWWKIGLGASALLLVTGLSAFYLARAWRAQAMAEAEQRRVNADLVLRNDELSDLNEELRQIEAELTRHRDHLETLVHERTEALERSNLELRVARDAAEAGHRAKSRFLATVSHELRTPLNAVLAYSRMLRDKPPDGAAATKAGRIVKAGEQLLELIEEMLDYARLEGPACAADPQPFALGAALERACAGARASAGQKGLEMAVVVADDLPRQVLGDEENLIRALGHLAENAVKFTPAGSVHVRAERHPGPGGERLRISVRDTGIGIDPAQRDRLFMVFTQLDDSDARQYAGVGLGLALANVRARRMGGDIGVESVPGQGSVFWLDLPLVPVPEAA